MPSPFPGMDPYLEDPYVFPDLHHRFASHLSDALNQRLPGPYYARVEMRPEVGIVDEGEEAGGGLIGPDVLVLRRPKGPPAGAAALAVSEPLAGARTEISPWVAFAPLPEPMARHYFVEIRDAAQDHKLITLVEILSPSNKRRGKDRNSYEAKQRQVLESDASLIEIDLLRAGRRILPHPHLEVAIARLEPRPDYVVLLSRAWERDEFTLGYIAFPFALRDPLPCIPTPLKEGEPEPPLDLQAVFRSTYDTGAYRRGMVDYSRPPKPPLSTEDAAWAEGLLRAL